MDVREERWHVANLGDAMLAGAAVDAVRARFAEHGGDSAVLMRHESDGRLHCELKLYFPPELAALAREFDTRPCPRPSADGLGVLIGADDALTRLRLSAR
ncbi:MAG: hypothetical protein H6945_01675 [Zoogloeaceae bacterium]|nr:hypothetical protein [Rhodocyclaceae bacterium]MCP5234434.1 hypothetical protein [Zoogloeaceae bacterium]